MGLASITRHLSRALSHHDVEVSGADSASPRDIAKADKKLQRDRRSSSKASMYQHSPAHSGDTLHNPEHVPEDLSADVLVHVMTVGDSVITIESQREDDQFEQPLAKRKKRRLGIRRVVTAPASQTIPLHGSVTTIESVPNDNRLRAWSYPLVNWKDHLIRRMRRSTDHKEARKEARRDKISCELNSERQSFADVGGAQTPSQEPYSLMSGAYQESTSHVNLAPDEMGISPRTSIDLGNRPPAWMRPNGSPTNPATESNSSNGNQAKRKDSQLNLPPGFEVPAEGQAGPVDWLHRSWEEHYRRSAELAHRACHALTAARSCPARNEDLQRYNVVSTCHGSQCVQTQRVRSIPYSTEHVTQAWDFAMDGKGKGRRCEEDVDARGRPGTRDAFGAEHQRQRRRRSKGACVTTITLGECNFAKELEQRAQQNAEQSVA